MPLSISHYLKNMPLLTDQWNTQNYREPARQRIYLKDIDCPQLWHDKLKDRIPAGVFYLNESTGDVGGPGSADELNPYELGTKKGRGIARAGDLMSCLPARFRAENLMCYIGHEGTYTPAHREMCASLGQNIMVEASGSVDEDGKPTKPGSSIWFMTEKDERHLVSEYWLSTLGHDIEVESHFAQINAWKRAPFTTYIVEQKIGDFILIPPLAPHQVWNRGTRTMKVAWNRTTVETLEMALTEALPRARMVCRDEQYKNKSIVLFALQRYSDLLKKIEVQKGITSDRQILGGLRNGYKIKQLQKDFKRLFGLYTQIMLSELFSSDLPAEKRVQYIPYDSNITCSYCRCNIFNRFLTCTSCIEPLENGDEDTYDICMDCFAMGRSCRCISKFKWVEQFPWQDLVDKHELWRHQIIGFDGLVTEESPQPLHIARKQLGKKTLAQICQEQLKIRPWCNPKKELSEVIPIEEPEDQVDANGTIRKPRKKRRSEKWLQENLTCHVCKTREPKWKLAQCSCGISYCYGNLWRAFDMMPTSVMENPDWKCPRCLKICSCGACRKLSKMKPFEPKGTILGHDTKKVADPRSVESLVDFSHSNISWIKKAGDDHPEDTKRLRQRREEADMAKLRDPTLDDNDTDEEVTPMDAQSFDSGDGIPIDPQLSQDPTYSPDQSRSSEDVNSIDTPTDLQAKENRLFCNEASGGIHGPNPSVSALPDDSNQMKYSIQSEQAAEALRALDDMNHHSTNQPAFVAPTAVMISHKSNGRNVADTGLENTTFEYPDPTLPQMFPPPQRPSSKKESTARQKLNQLNSRKIISSDLSLSTSNIPPSPPEKTRLLVKLPISCSKLVQCISGSQDQQEHLESAVDDLQAQEEFIIVQSDLPKPSNGLHPSKKRKIRVENDDDFSTQNPKRRRTSSQQPLSASRKQSTLFVEASEESDEETIEGSILPDITLQTDAAPKTRRPNSYIARKDDINSDDIPKELQSNPKSRRLSSKKEHLLPKPPIANANVPNNARTAMRPIVVIDPFPPQPLPKPIMGLDISTLGAGAITADDDAADSVENKPKAKRVTFDVVVERGDNNRAPSSSKSASQDSRPKPTSSPSLTSRQSIFSKLLLSGRKIKIASAKSCSTGHQPRKEWVGTTVNGVASKR